MWNCESKGRLKLEEKLSDYLTLHTQREGVMVRSFCT